MSHDSDIPTFNADPSVDVPFIQVTAQDSTHDLQSYPGRPLPPDSSAIDTDEDAQEVGEWRSSGETSISRSPFLDMPSAESPWSKI